MTDTTIVDGPRDDRSHEFNVTLQMRAKHAALLAACRTHGSAVSLSTHLGIRYQTLLKWIAMEAVPNFGHAQSPLSDPIVKAELERKLFELTGQTLDDLWPECIRSQDFLDLPKTMEVTTATYVRGLALQQESHLRLPAPEHEYSAVELRDALNSALKAIPRRYADVLRKRFGLDGPPLSLSEAAASIKVTRERVRQMEIKAIAMIQDASPNHPGMAQLFQVARDRDCQ